MAKIFFPRSKPPSRAKKLNQPSTNPFRPAQGIPRPGPPTLPVVPSDYPPSPRRSPRNDGLRSVGVGRRRGTTRMPKTAVCALNTAFNAPGQVAAFWPGQSWSTPKSGYLWPGQKSRTWNGALNTHLTHIRRIVAGRAPAPPYALAPGFPEWAPARVFVLGGGAPAPVPDEGAGFSRLGAGASGPSRGRSAGACSGRRRRVFQSGRRRECSFSRAQRRRPLHPTPHEPPVYPPCCSLVYLLL
jgi:hypothetical protein